MGYTIGGMTENKKTEEVKKEVYADCERGNLIILFDTVKHKYDYVANADDCLDRKAGALMGFEITWVIGYFSFLFKNVSEDWMYMSIIGLVLLGVSILCLMVINWPKDYTTISVNLLEHREYFGKNGKASILQLISDAQDAFTKNNAILRKKSKFYQWAITLLIISSFCFVLPYVL